MKKVVRIRKGRKVEAMSTQVLRTVPGDREVESLVAVIQTLIPLGLAAVEEALQGEVRRLAGERYQARESAAWAGPVGTPAGLGLPLGPEAPRQGPARTRPPAGV